MTGQGVAFLVASTTFGGIAGYLFWCAVEKTVALREHLWRAIRHRQSDDMATVETADDSGEAAPPAQRNSLLTEPVPGTEKPPSARGGAGDASDTDETARLRRIELLLVRVVDLLGSAPVRSQADSVKEPEDGRFEEVTGTLRANSDLLVALSAQVEQAFASPGAAGDDRRVQTETLLAAISHLGTRVDTLISIAGHDEPAIMLESGPDIFMPRREGTDSTKADLGAQPPEQTEPGETNRPKDAPASFKDPRVLSVVARSDRR